MKFNSSDTLYCIDTYGFKKETTFTILNKDEKERIQNILDTITFPKNETFENNDMDDGTTYGFILQDQKRSKKLKIHGNAGPQQFWYFGEVLEKIKLNLQFAKTNKKIDLKEINKMVIFEIPPTFTIDTVGLEK
ncbi:MAG: hypothetical protein ACN6OI_21920 [Flavobacterium sp.]|uniref:hypothetical protein n=1 Tax=unclassified Flavobacterium TaxID=196869 RepID=UPI002A69D684|nr:hypothetical protein [Flavobacterium sp. CFBP9031]